MPLYSRAFEAQRRFQISLESDLVNGFNGSASVCISPDEVDPDLDPFPLQPHGFGKNACEYERTSTSTAGYIEGPPQSESVSHLNTNLISKTGESILERGNFPLANTVSIMCHGLFELPRSATSGTKICVSVSHEEQLHCPDNWFVLIENNEYN